MEKNPQNVAIFDQIRLKKKENIHRLLSRFFT